MITQAHPRGPGAVQGVKEITSTSTEGSSRVRVAFTWMTDVAANDIRDRVDRIMGRLPEDIDRPRIYKFDISSFPILYYGISSTLDPLDLRQLVEDQVKYRLVAGTGCRVDQHTGRIEPGDTRRPESGPAQIARFVNGYGYQRPSQRKPQCARRAV